jgi:hypothetical protein
LVGHERHPRSRRRFDHPIGVGAIERHRLLDEDVAAGLGRSDRDRRVGPRRGEHVHGIDAVDRQHLVEIAVDRGVGRQLGEGPCLIPVAITQSDQTR